MESICRVFLSVLSWGLSNSKPPVQDPILGVEVAHCSIGVVLGVIQVVQIWFTRIPNTSRSSRLDEVVRCLSEE